MKGKPAKLTEDIGGWYVSEKLDGMRCLWDGGVSRGVPIADVPWANTGKGDTAIATGLWSYYANPINAPEWFVNALPVCPLDGELFGGRGEYQKTMSVCRKKVPIDEEWRRISFQVFSTPPLMSLFQDGEIKHKHLEKKIVWEHCLDFSKCLA